MINTSDTAQLDDIQKIVGQIVQQFHPEKIILFGSYAHGEPTSDSDVDLLVVMDTEDNPLHVAASIAAAIDHPFPLDILVWKPQQLVDRLASKGGFATELATRGKVFYEA